MHECAGNSVELVRTHWFHFPPGWCSIGSGVLQRVRIRASIYAQAVERMSVFSDNLPKWETQYCARRYHRRCVLLAGATYGQEAKTFEPMTCSTTMMSILYFACVLGSRRSCHQEQGGCTSGVRARPGGVDGRVERLHSHVAGKRGPASLGIWVATNIIASTPNRELVRSQLA